MPAKNDLTGIVFGRLTAIREDADRSCGKVSWVCACECGNEKSVAAQSLLRLHTKSCGCLRREIMRDSHTKHGKHGTPGYATWTAMRQRCGNPYCEDFSRYGARGISVCEKWSEFANFISDMGPPPSSRYSLDRIDNDGNYEPSNCRWALKITQANNTRRNRFVEWCGVRKTISQWSVATGISKKAISNMAKRGGDTLGKLMNRWHSLMKENDPFFSYGGESLTITQWASRLGVKMPTLSKRLRQYGWTIEECVAGKRNKAGAA